MAKLWPYVSWWQDGHALLAGFDHTVDIDEDDPDPLQDAEIDQVEEVENPDQVPLDDAGELMEEEIEEDDQPRLGFDMLANVEDRNDVKCQLENIDQGGALVDGPLEEDQAAEFTSNTDFPKTCSAVIAHSKCTCKLPSKSSSMVVDCLLQMQPFMESFCFHVRRAEGQMSETQISGRIAALNDWNCIRHQLALARQASTRCSRAQVWMSVQEKLCKSVSEKEENLDGLFPVFGPSKEICLKS